MNFRERILSHLSEPSYVPVSCETLAKHWRLKSKERPKLAREISVLVKGGSIVLVKGDRLCLPKIADLVTGKISFRQSGSAIVFPESRATEPRKDPIQVAAENTGVALHGDTVVLRLIVGREREQFRFLKPG